MLSQDMRNKVDSLWETFWTGGITNPLDVIEQITYLMFVRDLGTLDAERSKEATMLGQSYESIFDAEHEDCRWSSLRDMAPELMYKSMSEKVFPFIKKLHSDKDSAYSKYMGDALFKVPTPALLSKIVTQMDLIDWEDKDIRGDLYEHMLSKLATSGTNGQFRTPRHIIRMMVELIDPKPDDTICDPAFGTAGFLIGAAEYLKETYFQDIFYDSERNAHYNNDMFTGYDMDRTMLRIGAMNMMSHNIANPTIEYRDSLSEQNEDTDRYSVILANPPFKGSLDAETVSPDLIKGDRKTKKTELLFLSLFLRMLRVGGRCAAIVPDGVLFGSSKAHKAIRKEIVENNRLEAVISMPSGVFKPYAGVSTAVLVFTKTGHGGTDDVWFYDMRNDGYSLDDKRTPIEGSDLPDIVARFRNLEAEKSRKRTEQSFLVPKAGIAANSYDLSINKYKEVEYEPVEYPPTSEILDDLEQGEAEIKKNLAKLREMLGDD
jgi:type I restriction enzyme M protein